MMSKITQAYFTLLKFIIVACLAAMVIMVFSNVVMRYAFNTGLPVSEELARWCFHTSIEAGLAKILLDCRIAADDLRDMADSPGQHRPDASEH
jgi:TRAP-type C4-dicarboxylate transport system permease small subunit